MVAYAAQRTKPTQGSTASMLPSNIKKRKPFINLTKGSKTKKQINKNKICQKRH
jgi:hypothetical protein